MNICGYQKTTLLDYPGHVAATIFTGGCNFCCPFCHNSDLNEEKAKILYDFLDESKLFKGTVEPKDRSLMNVPFVTGDKEMDAKFIKEATEAGFVNLKGHRSVGGMRASIYNAMPKEGVEALVAFMRKFEEANA